MANCIASISALFTGIGVSAVGLMRRIRKPVTFAVCRFFIRLHINQSHLTVTRIFLLVGFYFAWVESAFWIALGLMLVAWALDCMDGDLSRMLKHDDAVGEFEDVFGDNLVFVIFPMALIQTDLLTGALGALFVFCAFSVLWMAQRQQTAGGGPAALVFHPKGDLLLSLSRKAVWILMYQYVFFRFDMFNASYLVLTALLLIAVGVNYFQIIRARLEGD
jgi:phosphatidylglycerophosphate synthase